MTDTKTILLCGGPGNGHRVDVLATATTYVWTEMDWGGPLFPGQLLPPSMPTYTHALYKISVALTCTGQGIWVGFPADYTNDQADQVVTKVLLAEESHKDWPRNFSREQYAVYTDQRTRIAQEDAMAFPTITADQDRRRAESIKQLYRVTGIPLAQLTMIYDRAVQDIRTHSPQAEETVVADGEVHMTIKSRNPDKWRFLDLETGQTWRWDADKDAFVLVTY